MKLFPNFLRPKSPEPQRPAERHDAHPLVVLDHLRAILGTKCYVSVKLEATADSEGRVKVEWSGYTSSGSLMGEGTYRMPDHIKLAAAMLSKCGRDLSEDVLRAQCEALGYELVKHP